MQPVLQSFDIGKPIDSSSFIDAMRLQEQRREHDQNHNLELQKMAEAGKAKKDAEAAATAKMQHEQTTLISPLYDPSKYKTNNDYAQSVVNDQLSKNIGELSKTIAAGGTTDPELFAKAYEGSRKIGMYANSVNSATQRIDQLVQKNKDTNPGVDWDAVGRAATSKIMHMTDPTTGKERVVSDSSEVGDADQIFQDTLKNNTSAFVQPGQVALKSDIDKLRGLSTPIEHVDDDPSKSIKGELYPFEETTKDKTGNINGKQIKSIFSPAVPKNISPDGKMVTDDLMKMLSPSTKLMAKSEVDDYIKKNKLDPKLYQPDSPAYDVLMKAQLHRDISELAPSQLQQLGKSNLTAAQRNLDNGTYYGMKAIANEFKNQNAANKKSAEDQEFNKNPVAIGIRALNNDQAILKDMPVTNIAGKPHYDFTSSLGNLKIGGQDEDKKDRVIQGFYKDVSGSGFVVKFNKGEDAKPFIGHAARANGAGKFYVHFDQTGAKSFLKAIAPLNGLAPEDVDKMSKDYEKPAISVSKTPDKNYNINGKTYSHKDLLKNYSEEQINQAIKLGNIKQN